LSKIEKLWNNESHKTWFNGRKKIHSINNTMIVKHQCMFIHIDNIYPF
jgi:hypothetical protein